MKLIFQIRSIFISFTATNRLEFGPLEYYLEAIVCPAAEFELAFLIVKGKPGDVDFARALEDTRWLVVATPVAPHHHVGLIRAVKLFIRTETRTNRMPRWWSNLWSKGQDGQPSSSLERRVLGFSFPFPSAGISLLNKERNRLMQNGFSCRSSSSSRCIRKRKGRNDDRVVKEPAGPGRSSRWINTHGEEEGVRR